MLPQVSLATERRFVVLCWLSSLTVCTLPAKRNAAAELATEYASGAKSNRVKRLVGVHPLVIRHLWPFEPKPCHQHHWLGPPLPPLLRWPVLYLSRRSQGLCREERKPSRAAPLCHDAEAVRLPLLVYNEPNEHVSLYPVLHGLRRILEAGSVSLVPSDHFWDRGPCDEGALRELTPCFISAVAVGVIETGLLRRSAKRRRNEKDRHRYSSMHRHESAV
jgi:hypothetical protein